MLSTNKIDAIKHTMLRTIVQICWDYQNLTQKYWKCTKFGSPSNNSAVYKAVHCDPDNFNLSKILIVLNLMLFALKLMN